MYGKDSLSQDLLRQWLADQKSVPTSEKRRSSTVHTISKEHRDERASKAARCALHFDELLSTKSQEQLTALVARNYQYEGLSVIDYLAVKTYVELNFSHFSIVDELNPSIEEVDANYKEWSNGFKTTLRLIALIQAGELKSETLISGSLYNLEE